MKTKELTNYLRDRGLVGEITDSKITVYKNGRLIAYVSVDCLYGMNIYYPDSVTEGLYRRLTDYGKTPLAEREEEKRYYLRKIPVPLLREGKEDLWYCQPNHSWGRPTVDRDRGDDSDFKTIFTESEIALMDITGFEKVEVEG